MGNLTRTAKEWILDESNLTEEQKAVIKHVCFPRHVKPGNVLQKRIKRRPANGGFTDKELLVLDDYRYLTSTYNLAHIDMVKTHLPKDARGQDLTGKALLAAKKHLEKTQQAKSYKHDYFDATNVQEELEKLFARFCTPTPSENMFVEEAVKEKKKIAAPKEKALSNQDKGKAKKMYKEESKDATEIAEALKVEKQRVIEYLKTL